MENQLLIALSRNKLFRNIDISKIDLQNVKGKLITISEGEILYREGDSAEILFLLVSGQINILKKRLLGKTKSYLFRENDFLGHEEYFEETSRTSTAVALVDSYLISLTREEVDSLIKQDDEILANLKEPVPENFIEEMLRKENNLTSKAATDNPKPEETNSEDEEPVIRPTVVDEEKTMDFFKSISNFSRLNESNIIQPLENFRSTFKEPEEPQVLEPHNETIKQNEHAHAVILNEKYEEPVTDKLPFDENAFLNEDGIPKAEFELPEAKTETDRIFEPERKSDGSLDDALFQILSGGNVLNFEPQHKEEIISDKKEYASYNDFLTPQIQEETSNKIDVEPVSSPIIVEKETVAPSEEIKHEQMVPELDAHVEDHLNLLESHVEELPEIIEKRVEPFVQIKHEPVEIIFTPDEEEAGETLPSDFFSALERVYSSLDQKELYKNIIDSGKGITSSNYGIIFNLDWAKNELWTIVELGFGKKEIRLKIGEGLAGSSAKNGEPIIVNNIKDEKRFKFDIENQLNLDIKKLLVFPIKNKKNEIVAVLELVKNVPEDFSKADEEKLEKLSIFLATAINNSKSINNLIKKERSLSLSKVSNFLEQEIKQPLLASKRYLEHLKTKQLQSEANQVLDLLSEKLNQVSDVVSTTANYSEDKMPLRITNVSLNNTLSTFSLKAGQYVESKLCQIVNELSGDTTVKMDVKEFFQCYMNLIKNGCDAMPDGGKIIVTTKKRGRNIEIHIKDNGCGIGDELKPKLFEPFMSEGKKAGTGLGLAIAKKVVEAHSGSIHVVSEIGEGADFVITIPIVSSF